MLFHCRCAFKHLKEQYAHVPLGCCLTIINNVTSLKADIKENKGIHFNAFAEGPWYQTICERLDSTDNPTENQHHSAALSCQTNLNNASSFQITDSSFQLTSSYKSTVHHLPCAEWQSAKVNKWLVTRVGHLASQRDPDIFSQELADWTMQGWTLVKIGLSFNTWWERRFQQTPHVTLCILDVKDSNQEDYL